MNNPNSQQLRSSPAQDVQHSRLQHMPISFFAVVMGLMGLVLATLRLEHNLKQSTHTVSGVLLVVASAVFATIAVLYVIKSIRYWQDTLHEWNHPIRLSFFPAISISLILTGTALRIFYPAVAEVVWLVGSVLHIVFSVFIISTWMSRNTFVQQHLNPAWFIPAVGNVLIPVAGAGFGNTELSWMGFAVGMLFWLVLLALVFNRMIFLEPIPKKLYPTLFILVAPPAVGLIAWLQLTQELGVFGRVLYFIALFFMLILLVQVPKFAKLPFALSWWAYSFPVAAFTIATYLYAEHTSIAYYTTIAHVAYGLLVCIISMLILKTTVAISHGEICVPE